MKKTIKTKTQDSKTPQPKTAAPKTLDRVLSRAGLGSRTEARRWIADGRVAVNGKKALAPDVWVHPQRDRVTFDGHPLRAARKLYLLLYKPKGYLTTYKDPEGRATIYDLLKARTGPARPVKLPETREGSAEPGSVVRASSSEAQRVRRAPPTESGTISRRTPSCANSSEDVREWVFPAGRLDQDSSGLLLITNDTAFGNLVTDPESHVPKTYLVKASELLSDDQLQRLREGIQLADGPTRPAAVQRIRDSARFTFFEITLTEGRNRQVRRMVEALGAKVLKLVRTQIGSIGIGGLEIGKFRPLTPDEVRSLQAPRKQRR